MLRRRISAIFILPKINLYNICRIIYALQKPLKVNKYLLRNHKQEACITNKSIALFQCKTKNSSLIVLKLFKEK